MKLLLDTQCWLLWFGEPDRLNQQAIAAISDESNELWLSVASIWEIGIKYALGKLSLPESPEAYVSKRLPLLGTKTLNIVAAHALHAAALPPHHKDPFDRLLIAQAQLESTTILTADKLFADYPKIPVLWAAK